MEESTRKSKYVPAPIVQDRRSKLRTSVMKMFSFLGLEDFFTPMIIVLLWVLDTRFGILFTLLLGSGFYVASFFKCFLCLPRPPVPPVRPLVEENKDWALPSNHSIMGVIMPWFIWCYTRENYAHHSATETALIFVILVIFLGSGGVMISRLYLGVHSPVDLIAGTGLGIILLTAFTAVQDRIYTSFLQHSIWFCLTVGVVHLLLLYVHPRSWPETQSYGETVLTTSCALGMLLGRKIGPGTSLPLALLQQTPAQWSLGKILFLGFSRFLFGAVVLLGFRIVGKYSFRWCCFTLLKFFGLKGYSFSVFAKKNQQSTKHFTDAFSLEMNCNKKLDFVEKRNGFVCEGNELREHWEALRPEDRPFDVDVCTRYVVYFWMGWLGSEGCPALFRYLNI